MKSPDVNEPEEKVLGFTQFEWTVMGIEMFTGTAFLA
jgi:hypothetical protein